MSPRERWYHLKAIADMILLRVDPTDVDHLIYMIRKNQRIWQPEWNCWYELTTDVLERAYEAGEIHSGWCNE